MNGGGVTPSSNTRFSLRPVVNGGGAAVLCDNYGRILYFPIGDDLGCIAVVNGVATLISDIFGDVNYSASFNSYGGYAIEPTIDGDNYSISLPAVYQFPAASLNVTLGLSVSGVNNYVPVSADCYWRPAGSSKILCYNQGKILAIVYSDEMPSRQDIIDDTADVAIIYYSSVDVAPRMGETWADTPFYLQRRTLLESYDFEIILLPGGYASNAYDVPLPNGAILHYQNNGSQGMWQDPSSFDDYPG